MAEGKRPLRADGRPVSSAKPPPAPPPTAPPGARPPGGERPRRRRRWPWIALAVLLVPLALLGLLLLGLQTQPGRDLLRDLVVAQLEGPELSVEIGRIGGAPPGRIVLEDLAVADPEGVWLTADRLLLDWSPLALLGGTLSVEELAAGEVAVARLPAGEAPAEPEPEGGFSLPTLPLAVELERLRVERLALAEPVAGEPLELSIAAALAAEREGLVESSLTVEELAGEGRFEGRALYREAERSLSMSLQASAPSGGRVSRLSGLPGAPALSVSLDGEGTLPGWQGRLRAEAGPVASLDGRLGIDSLQPLQASLTAELEPGAEFPAEAAPWVRPRLQLALGARYDAGAESAALSIDRLESAALALTGTAEAALAEDAADARLTLQLRDPAPLQALVPGLGLEAGRIEATASKRGERASLALDGALQQVVLDGFGFGQLAVALEAEALALDDPLAESGPVRVTLTGETPLGDPQLAGLLAPTTTLAAELAPAGEILQVARLELDSGPLSLSGSGRYRLQGEDAGSGSLQARFAAGELARFSELAGLDLAGRLAVTLDAELEADGSARASLLAQPEALSLGVPAAQALLGERPELSVVAERAADGTIRIAAADLTGTPVESESGLQEPLRLHVEGLVEPEAGQLDATASLALPQLSVLQAAGLQLAGSATLDLSAFGPLDAPQAVWALRAEPLSYQGRTVARLALDGTTVGLPDSPSGGVTIEAATPAGPLSGSFDYALADETARLSELSISRGGDRLSGTLAANLESGTAEGAIELELTDLSAYEPLLGLALDGSLQATLALEAEAGRQDARLSARGRQLGLDGLQLAGLEIEGRARDLTGRPSLSAEATARDLEAEGLEVRRLAVDAEGGLDALSLQASLDGRALERELAASAAAELALEEAIGIRLTALEASLGEERLALESPARILLGDGRTRVEDLALALADGRLTLDAELRPERIEAALEAQGLPVRLVELVAPDLEPQGRLDLSARLSGSPPRPEGSLSLSATGLRMSPVAGEDVPPLSLQLEGRLARGRLALDGRAGGFADAPLTLQAELPLRVTAAPGVELPENEPLSARLDWQGRLEQVMAVLPIDAVRFGGQADLDLRVEGTLADPQTAGSIAVTEGFYQNYLLGMQLQPVELRVSGQGKRIEVERFTARDSEGGSMSAEGVVDLSGEAPRFDLSFEADEARVAQRDDVSGAVDAELALRGSTEGASLKGTVRVLPTEIRLIDALPPSVSQLEVVEVGAGAPERAQEAEEAEADPGVAGLRWLSLDVGVEIPGQVFVRGRGLDSEWRGALQVSGSAEQPRILGRLSPVRGSFDFAGRVFELSPDSTIQFLGAATPDPELDITATYRADDFSASVLIYGPVSDPEFELTSSPPLPEDEILSRVLFGKSSGQLSAAEAVQLAQAAETLRGGDAGLMDIARRTLGVDVLSFAPGNGADEIGSLRVGKYVTEDVFVGAEQGTSPGSSTAIVEWELTPNISVESEVGADSRSNATINWKWDY